MNPDIWMQYSLNLRKKILKEDKGGKKYLLANFSGTQQKEDIERRTSVIRDFFRIKINVKGWVENEVQKNGGHAADFSDREAVLQAMRDEFDIPYWAFSKKNQPLENLKKYNDSFIYQLKACNISCPWCYVDDVNKNGGMDNNPRFFSMPEIIDAFEEESKKKPLRMFRISGGEPTLAAEQWLEALNGLKKRRLKDVYVQTDTNLTTGHFLDYLEKTNRIDKNLLEKAGKFSNFGVLCSFKGTDTESLLGSVGIASRVNGIIDKGYSFLEDERWYSFSKIVRAGIDAYPFVYDPNPETLGSFMEKGAGMFGDGFYLKTWIFPLKFYGPERERLRKRGKNPEHYQKKLDDNFGRSREVMQDIIWKKFRLNYQATPRTGIELKLK